MSLKCPETGLVFALILALSGGALLGQNRTILNIENEIVHWLIVIGVVLYLCLISFYIGLFFRLQKFDHDEYWRQDILQMMEKDSSIVKIQGKRIHKTIILEEFTRPDPNANKNSISGFLSIFSPTIAVAAASDIPPTTNATTTTEENGEEEMMANFRSTSSSESDETITSPEEYGAMEENGEEEMMANFLDKTSTMSSDVTITSPEEYGAMEENGEEEMMANFRSTSSESDETITSPGEYGAMEENGEEEMMANFRSTSSESDETITSPGEYGAMEENGEEEMMANLSMEENGRELSCEETNARERIPKPLKENGLIVVAMKEPEFKRLDTQANLRFDYIQRWSYAGDVEEIDILLKGKGASLKKRLSEVSCLDLKPQPGVPKEVRSKQNRDKLSSRPGN